MTQSIEACVQAARVELVRARALLQEEIRNYPTPVSGCDVQYTHLIAEQRKVSAALGVLDQDVFVPTPRTLSPGAGVESR